MIGPDTRRSEQLNDIRAASPLSRHFPTCYLLWRSVVFLATWSWRHRRLLWRYVVFLATRSWRHRRAFANVTLLAALAAVVLYGCREYAIGTQRDAVAAINRAGGSVSYDWEWSNGRPLPSRTGPPWPTWLVKALGPDCFGHVVAVHLANRRADGALMMHIGHLTRLVHLNLFGGAVSGEDLAHLETLTSLETLALPPQFKASDDDLAHLAGLTRLKRLILFGARITNKGLGQLAGQRQLESLQLLETEITTLEPVRALMQLKELNLTGSPIEDEGLKPLAGFTSLKRLWLNQTRVTDAGIPHLSALADLTQLDLSQTQIGDAGAPLLFKLPEIICLYLGDTSVTDMGLAEWADRLNRSTCRTLVVSGPNVTIAGIAELRKKLPRTLVLDRDLNTQPAPSRAANTPPPTTDDELP